jgi:hypothetical protein
LYQCTIIISTPYHPKGNAPIERQHQVLVKRIYKLTGNSKGIWPRYIYPALFVICVTVSRSTGYSPYYLLYSIHLVFSFDVAEHTWQTLDWDNVTSHQELIEIQARQILHCDKKMNDAIAELRKSRKKAIDDAAKCLYYKFNFSNYEEGMYMWLQEAKLNKIKGGKGEWTYSELHTIHKVLNNDTYIL